MINENEEGIIEDNLRTNESAVENDVSDERSTWVKCLPTWTTDLYKKRKRGFKLIVF